jgi:hypothetical protein
VHKL